MPQRNEREYRTMTIGIVKRDGEGNEEEKRVAGYASTFDEPYLLYDGDGWQYWETVDKNAFDETDMSDVIMQYDHEGRIFARTRNNTLEVETDDKGLLINADLGGTELGRQLYDEISGGYTDRMSFGFTISKQYEKSEKNPDGVRIYTRHITSVGKLYDVSAVSIPANDGTSIGVATRGRIDGVIEEIRAERLEAEKLQLERRRAEVRAKALGKETK